MLGWLVREGVRIEGRVCEREASNEAVPVTGMRQVQRKGKRPEKKANIE